MGAFVRVNEGIEKGQWGSWSAFIGNALIHLFELINVSMFFTNLNSMKGLGAGFK